MKKIIISFKKGCVFSFLFSLNMLSWELHLLSRSMSPISYRFWYKVNRKGRKSRTFQKFSTNVNAFFFKCSR